MVLTVQTAEITTRTGDGEALGARVEMVEWCLLYRVDGKCTRLGIDLTDEHATIVVAAATDACPSIGDATVVWTE